MNANEQLRDTVMDELAWDMALDASAVGVAAQDGVVTLMGHVRSYAEKRAAEKAARRVRGVVAIANEIEVRPPGPMRRDDIDIATQAARVLRWTVGVPVGITAAVSNGWVTLEGTVRSSAQRRAAERAVRDLVGVRGVTNAIRVKPVAQPLDAEQQIRHALERSAQLQADDIVVRVHDGRATLSGTVRSWSELIEAEHTARAAPGITDVDNRLTVVSVPALQPTA